MSKYSFSHAERFAVYVTHDEKCYMCSRPLDLKTMEVDHVIPESLLDKPEELREVIESLGRSKSFDVNSYANWMPACRPCNGKKLATVFDPSPLIQLVLQRAAERTSIAEKLEQQTVSQKAVMRALNVLERANEAGELNTEVISALQPLMAFQASHRSPSLSGEVIRLTPHYEVISENDRWRIVRGPYGVGGRPIGPHVHSSYDCHNCGAIAAWNGARCVVCGELNDE